MRKNYAFSEISVIGLVFEVILISFVFLFISYFSNKTDPLFLNYDINLLLILVSVVTLYYGLLASVILLVIFGISFYIFYSPFPIYKYLNLVLFSLIFSEFHYFWNRIIDKIKNENKYIESKFSELNKNFYFLKLSHDQIEKSYIIKPQSLRNTINQIKKIYLEKPDNAFEEILTVISKNYGIKSAAIFSFDGNFQKISSINFNESLNEESLVLNDAIEKKTISYLSKFDDHIYDYLAVIPAYDSDDNLRFVMVIKEMQFLNFTKDNLSSIWVILNYFSDFINGIDYAKDIIKENPHCPPDFIVEIKRLSYLRKKLEIKSMILVIKFKEIFINLEDINNFISRNLRAMDISCYKEDSIHIIFPFNSYSNIEVVMDKIERQLKERFGLKENDFRFMVFEVLPDYYKTIEWIVKSK
jgi:hypothetical protein